MEPVFLSLDEILEIHSQQIERYGGSSGFRDAAGLARSTANSFTPQLQPFIDGNKRVGANAAITFLLMNDWEPVFE